MSIASWICRSVEAFVVESALNRLVEIDGSPIFDRPLVGLADGDDSLFARYKEIIGPFHRTPREALAEEAPIEAGEPVGVVAWILPITQTTRDSNRERDRSPSMRWAHTKQYGEALNDALRRHLVALLREAGYRACAPALSPAFKVVRDEAVRPPSANWSERHIAYAAGLGTFGLSDGLITARGIAHRCGSVVVGTQLEPTPRVYVGPYDYCLFHSQGTCGACMARCPAGAITAEGHDKALCGAYTGRELGELHRQEYGVTQLTCGLCQVGVPCEDGVPTTLSHVHEEQDDGEQGLDGSS
jgi:epoxyqueuosine reductase